LCGAFVADCAALAASGEGCIHKKDSSRFSTSRTATPR
jgi:hypothetical protein